MLGAASGVGDGFGGGARTGGRGKEGVADGQVVGEGFCVGVGPRVVAGQARLDAAEAGEDFLAFCLLVCGWGGSGERGREGEGGR